LFYSCLSWTGCMSWHLLWWLGQDTHPAAVVTVLWAVEKRRYRRCWLWLQEQRMGCVCVGTCVQSLIDCGVMTQGARVDCAATWGHPGQQRIELATGLFECSFGGCTVERGRQLLSLSSVSCGIQPIGWVGHISGCFEPGDLDLDLWVLC
jgi:hypothetical protein